MKQCCYGSIYHKDLLHLPFATIKLSVTTSERGKTGIYFESFLQKVWQKMVKMTVGTRLSKKISPKNWQLTITLAWWHEIRAACRLCIFQTLAVLVVQMLYIEFRVACSMTEFWNIVKRMLVENLYVLVSVVAQNNEFSIKGSSFWSGDSRF